MKSKSIKKNALLNVVRIIMLAIFPLITFPYATRVLGAENIGKVQFATSFIVFFQLIATLGINTYAVREGTPLRDNRKKISKFASQILSINLITSFISYLFLFLVLLIPTKLCNYSAIILILSLQIIFTTIGVDWIYTIYEDFLYITIRSVLIQLLSLILMFIFVKDRSDYYIYSIIIVLASSSVYIFNYFHSKKYVDIKITLKPDINKYIKPLLVLFSNDIAQQIYINSDLLMLGLMTSDVNVGLYTVSVKIYTLVKRVLNSIIAVAIPRMSYYNTSDGEKFNKLVSSIINFSILILLPIMVLLFLLSDNLILLISGKEFILGSTAIKILSFGLLFAIFANVFCNGILIIKNKEKYVLKGTILAAITNFLLNIVFISLYKQNGAAFTTVISEFVIMIYSYIKAKEYIKNTKFFKNLICELFGCLGIVLIYYLMIKLNITDSNIVFMTMVTICGMISYLLIEIILKNTILINYIKSIKICKIKKNTIE